MTTIGVADRIDVTSDALCEWFSDRRRGACIVRRDVGGPAICRRNRVVERSVQIVEPCALRRAPGVVRRGYPALLQCGGRVRVRRDEPIGEARRHLGHVVHQFRRVQPHRSSVSTNSPHGTGDLLRTGIAGAARHRNVFGARPCGEGNVRPAPQTAPTLALSRLVQRGRSDQRELCRCRVRRGGNSRQLCRACWASHGPLDPIPIGWRDVVAGGDAHAAQHAGHGILFGRGSLDQQVNRRPRPAGHGTICTL